MPQSCFDRQYQRLSERLLQAGIAPRHVRRTARELSDHFDDLVREEKESGASREQAETRALLRLGNEDDLAAAMLARPELRSCMARFPWAVFGLGPVLMLVASVYAAIWLELVLLQFGSFLVGHLTDLKPGPVTARWFTLVFTGYDFLAVYVLPLAFAGLLYWVGRRQMMPRAWIVTGGVLLCVLGGFQNLIWYDTGVVGGGHFIFNSGLLYFFPHLTEGTWLYSREPYLAQGFARAAMNLSIAGGVWWWLTARKRASTAVELHTART